MKMWQEDYLNSLLRIESEQELFDEIAVLAEEMGFDYCAYGIQMPVPISRPFVASFNNFSKGWLADRPQYGDSGDAADLALATDNPQPPATMPASDLQVDMPGMSIDAGEGNLRYGWTQFSHDPSGSIGMLTLARNAARLTDSELFDSKVKMTWLAQFSHSSMSRLLVPKYAPETLISMTLREKQVLRWTAEGKTAYEIGQILAVSERTVNFHINNVVTKLSASNKTQAAVKAAALGMLA